MKPVRKPILIAVAVMVVAVAAAGVAAGRSTGPADESSTYGYLKLFNEVLTLVRSSYVEEIPERELLRGAYEGLLTSLDGENEYLTAADYAALKASKPGSEAESGLFLTRRDGILFVAAVLPGSDAQSKGIRTGDQIRRIGDKAGRDLTLTRAEQALRGPAGSRVSLSVSRREEPRREDLEVARKKLSLPPPRLDPVQDGVGVIHLPSLSAGSAKSISGFLDKLQKEKVTRLVLDLRGNAWGDLDETARVAALFTGQGILATFKDRQGGETPVQAAGTRNPWTGSILLLTDAGTSFAAEALVAALVDRNVAKQAGETTLGRGGEQEILPLGNGDYLSITVRKLLSPSGKPWHGAGLAPGVPMPQDMSVPFKDRAESQLRKAVEWLRDQAAPAKAA